MRKMLAIIDVYKYKISYRNKKNKCDRMKLAYDGSPNDIKLQEKYVQTWILTKPVWTTVLLKICNCFYIRNFNVETRKKTLIGSYTIRNIFKTVNNTIYAYEICIDGFNLETGISGILI